MSTKIHNGYLLNIDDSILALTNFKKEVFELCSSVRQTEYMKIFFERCAKALDESLLGITSGLDENTILATKVSRTISESAAKNRSVVFAADFDWDCDFALDLAVIPANGKLLLMAFAENQAIKKAFEAHPAVTEYCYWNNTDAPNEVSKEEWNERKKDWDTVSIPARDGVMLEIFNHELTDLSIPTPDIIERYKDLIPTKAVRAKSLARTLLIDEKLSGLTDGPASISSVCDAIDWVAKNPEILESRASEIASCLPEITADLLWSKLGG